MTLNYFKLNLKSVLDADCADELQVVLDRFVHLSQLLLPAVEGLLGLAKSLHEVSIS